MKLGSLYAEKLQVKALLGTDITTAVRDAVVLSAQEDAAVEFEFNGGTVQVDCRQFISALVDSWRRGAS